MKEKTIRIALEFKGFRFAYEKTSRETALEGEKSIKPIMPIMPKTRLYLPQTDERGLFIEVYG